MSGGNEDARNKMGAERIFGLVVSTVGCVTQAIKKYSTLKEMRAMNLHIKQNDELAKQKAAAKQAAADKPVS